MNRPGQTRRGILAGAAVALLLSIPSTVGTPFTATAHAEQSQKAKKYKATRAYVVDKDTGAVRMPTQEEVNDVISNLATMGQRPDDTLQQTQTGNGVSIDLDGGYNGILLARPNEDGTWETQCVFTIEEGAAFLGLVVDDAQ